MNAAELAAIRARNAAVKACCVTGEVECSKSEHDSALVCCIHDDPDKLTQDIDALLAEVERLTLQSAEDLRLAGGIDEARDALVAEVERFQAEVAMLRKALRREYFGHATPAETSAVLGITR